MALALTLNEVEVNLRHKDLYIKAVASGNYSTGGDTVNLTSISNPANKTNGTAGYPGTIVDYEVEQGAGGYTAELIPGATLATWKLKIFSAPGTELAAGAYPAAITADFFILRFKGPKLRF